MNYTFRSKEELYFSWWLEELVARKYIKSWTYEEKSYTLLNKVCLFKPITKKGKADVQQQTLLNGISYTPDFHIKWNDCHLNTYPEHLFQSSGLYKENGKVFLYSDTCVVDVKGSFIGRNNNSAITFPFAQKLMWDKYQIYVHKIIPVQGKNSLFNKTFYPERYKLTDSGNAPRKIGNTLVSDFVLYKSLDDYIEQRKEANDKSKRKK